MTPAWGHFLLQILLLVGGFGALCALVVCVICAHEIGEEIQNHKRHPRPKRRRHNRLRELWRAIQAERNLDRRIRLAKWEVRIHRWIRQFFQNWSDNQITKP